MSPITVRFYSLWQIYLGTDHISLPADNVAEAMSQIEERFGSRLREQLQSRGIQANLPIQDYSLLLLNGYNVDKQNLQQVKLKEGDILHIFPLAMGG